MNVLFFIPRMGSGGAERVISVLSNSFVQKGHTVHIAQLIESDSFYPLDDKVTLSDMGISIRRNNKIVALWDQARFFFKGVQYIKREIKKRDPDVVIAFMRQSGIIMWIARMLGCKAKLICSERNDPTVQSPFVRFIMRRVYKSSDLLVCQGQTVADYFSSVKNKVVIPNPVNGERLADRAETIISRVVAVGRLDKQKNFELLINSFAHIYPSFPQYRLDIYGEGPERDTLQRLIDSKDMQNHICLCGAKKNVQELISDAALFVMSSNYEGFPNALLEAMSIGLPVISTDFSTGIAHELIENENGLVVPVGDEQAMSQAISELLSDEERMAKMGKCNRQKCEKFYTPQIIEKWEDAIKSII